MASGREHAVLRSVRTLFGVGAVGGMSDGQLLERFAGRRDEGAEVAFAALVERHGPMVLGVCRGVLRDPDRTEDAFQATFLVLVRKCGSIRNRDSIGGWLYGVARRVAVRSKAGDMRRRLREREAAAPREGSPATDESLRDQLEILREEIARLPEESRAPVVLCHLEGMTYQEAARHLGVTEDAVRGRLFRAREHLRARLTRRGVAVPCGPAGAALWQEAAAAMPAGLAGSTARAAMKFASGEAPAAGEVSALALALARGVLKAMFLYKLTGAAATVVALAAVVTGTALQAQQEPRRGRSDDPARPPAGAADRDLTRVVPGRIVRDREVTKDSMVLSYISDWAHGELDNLAVANNDGGVRALIDWPELNPDAVSPGTRVFLALYSRETTSGGPAGSVLAFPVLGDWPEATSWATLPEYGEEPASTTRFVPGEGWKLFDVTSIVRAQARGGRKAHGVLLRFLREDRSGDRKDWSGYAFASREATGEWEDRRPRLLVVRPDRD